MGLTGLRNCAGTRLDSVGKGKKQKKAHWMLARSFREGAGVGGWLDPEGESGLEGQETPSGTRRSFADTDNSKLDQTTCFKNLKLAHHFRDEVEAPGRTHRALHSSSYCPQIAQSPDPMSSHCYLVGFDPGFLNNCSKVPL